VFFIIADNDKVSLAIVQVTDTLTLTNTEREISGCIAAMRSLGLTKSFLITNDKFYRQEQKTDYGTIMIIPAWKFSLNIKRYIWTTMETEAPMEPCLQ